MVGETSAVFESRDQFSLALGVATTMPHEIGSTPGFIFLDEPLTPSTTRGRRRSSSC
jgi:hypothetical protein